MAAQTSPDAPVELLCPECRYNLTVVPSDRCPWCGWIIDREALLSSAGPRPTGQRLGVVAAAGVVGAGSLLVALSLGTGGKHLELRDAVILFAVLLAAGGHGALAVTAAVPGGHWPLRARELRAILAMAGWVSILAGAIGSTQALDFAPTPRIVEGVKVNGVLELVLTSALFTLPGWSLLILRMISFRAGAAAEAPAEETPSGPPHPRRRGGAPFLVEFARTYRRDQVTPQNSTVTRARSPALEAAVARIWECEHALAQDEGKILYNGELGRLVRAEADPDGLRLHLGCTSYREFVGTNLHNATAVGGEGAEHFADPLGISAVVVTLDGWLALGRRGRRVAHHPGRLHPFGGMLEPADRRAGGGYDAFAGAARELMEEAGVRAHEISDLIVVGMVRDLAIHQPELIFEASIRLSRAELEAVFDPRRGDGEHTAIELVADEPEALVAFLERSDSATPVAQATLLLRGRHTWGAAWFDSACLCLYGELPAQPAPAPPVAG